MSQSQYKWYEQSGSEGDVVISTRIRLARNLNNTPFPAGLSEEARKEIALKIRDAFQQSEAPSKAEYDYLEKAGMPFRNIGSMVERHLISPEFAKQDENGAMLLKRDESVSIMIGEEDHIRIQVMRPGLDLDEAYRIADELDTQLDSQLHFAFDDRLGYLTQCPTNLGTGMRASVMMHLPSLQERGKIQQLANTVSKLGLTIRGLYGEGTKPEGAIYQLSNQITLGISEQAAIDNLKGIAVQIIREERSGREQMKQNPRLEDMVWRSLGVMQTARLMTNDEFMGLCSNLRLGISLGYITHITPDTLNKLINDVQPATLMVLCGHDMDADERDTERARIVRERLMCK